MPVTSSHADECDELMDKAKPRLERSGVSDSTTGEVRALKCNMYTCTFLHMYTCNLLHMYACTVIHMHITADILRAQRCHTYSRIYICT